MRLFLTFLLLNSCAIYTNHLRENVTYDGFVIKQKRTDQVYQLNNFNSASIDSTLSEIDEFAKCKLRLVITNEGQVLNVIVLKNSFSQKNLAQLKSVVEKTRWLPYINIELSTTILTIVKGKEEAFCFDNEQRIVRDDELEEFGL